MNQPLSTQEITSAVSDSVQQDVGDIRTRVRDLTLRALQTRRLEADEIREVVRAVAEGVSLGAEHRAGEVKQALASALSGLDDALAKAAQATHLALQELLSKSKDFTDQDLKHALDDLKITEQALLDTLGQVADAAGSKIRQELKDAVEHARHSGTDTGASVKATLSELGNRLSATLQVSKVSGEAAAHTLSGRLAALASGILAGMAEALREKSEPGQK
jgi:ElaB/YqjD/DUF883 family membrane-anchored ribosome-binding protein